MTPRAADEPQSVGSMVVRGVKYNVRLAVTEPTSYSLAGSGRFTTLVSGKDLYAETWEGLYKLAMMASKEAAVKVNIPLLKLEQQAHSWGLPTSFKAVTLTGQHQSNRNFLIRYSTRNGKDVTEQVDRYDRGSFYLPMTKEAQAEGLRLMDAHRKAQEALEKWQHEHGASLDKLFEVAEQEAMEKLDREEGRS